MRSGILVTSRIVNVTPPLSDDSSIGAARQLDAYAPVAFAGGVPGAENRLLMIVRAACSADGSALCRLERKSDFMPSNAESMTRCIDALMVMRAAFRKSELCIGPLSPGRAFVVHSSTHRRA